LTPAQGAVAVKLRTTLLSPLDGALAVVLEFWNPHVSHKQGKLLSEQGKSSNRTESPG
jgi:hypothetical protein